MIGFYELVDRTMLGMHCTESEFEMKILVPKIREVVSKYKLKYDPQNPIPYDDDLADRVFRAGFELYRDVGFYCPDTERVVRFSQEELEDALADAPSAPVFGEGKEAKTLVRRKPDSSVVPWCYVGAAGAGISSEELYASIMEAYASFLPLADSITAPHITTINGRTVQMGSPLEIMAAIRSVVLGREALRRGGRPGLPIMNCIASAVSDAAIIAGSQFGLRPSDSWGVGCTSELKIEFQRFNVIAFITTFGGHIAAHAAPIIGGYFGGPEGAAVANVAYHLNSIIALRGSYHVAYPIHFKYGCNTSRDTLWASSVSGQAVSRNSHFPHFDLYYLAAGPMTEMCFYETASCITTSVVSGASGFEFGGIAKASQADYFTPMEPLLASEVGHAVAGMTRKEANEILKVLLPRYESKLEDPPLGKKFGECWDIHRKTPSEEYVSLYNNVRKELSDLGIRF